MAKKGKISKDDLLRFVAILLIHMQIVNSQVLPELADTVEFSHTDEQMNHIREKRDVNTDIQEYIFIVEVNVPQVILLDQIKSLVASNNPLHTDNSTTIDGLNITAVCQQNGSEYLCTFDDQYVQPYNNCLTYNTCDNPDEATCTCISAKPSYGQVCVTKNVPLPNTTTPAMPTKTTTTTTIITTTTTAKVPLPKTTTHANPINTSTPSTTTAVVHALNFSLTINRPFDFALTDTSSATYAKYKKDIQSSIEDSYKSVPGYIHNSAKVIKFRPGSVIADFTIEATSDNLNLDSANKQLATSLRTQGYNLSDNASSQNVNGGLYTSNDYIYPASTLKLTCNPPENNGITWKMNKNILQPSDKYAMNNLTLTVNSVTPDDSGLYECSTTVNSVPYVIWQSITIQPYPDIQMTLSKVVKCDNIAIPLQCCFQGMYKGNWNATCTSKASVTTGCISCDYEINKQTCQSNGQVIPIICQLTPLSGSTTQSFLKSINIEVKNKEFSCSDNVFGAGDSQAISITNCTGDMVGNQTAKCNSSGRWDIIENNCIPRIFQTLINDAKILQLEDIPQFMTNLSSATVGTQNITGSPATIVTIVEILNTISNLSSTVLINQPIMMDFLQIVDVVGSEGARNTWVSLNTKNTTLNASSELLKATEDFARRLRDESMNITTNTTSLCKTNITASFSGTFGKNSTTQISLPEHTEKGSLTVIISSAFNNVLPVRNLTYNDSNQTSNQTSINGDVVLIETNSTINNISLSFHIKNNTLGNPQCVFWNFNLLNGIGGWDSTGCQLKKLGNETERITCECNHTTSFSILMSPFTLDENLAIVLDYITYIGVAISLGSLVLCLIIEMIIWKSVTRNDTSYMRHVSIVNIAVSLLIANICFIIGAAVVKKGVGPCSTATFFMHFFYLALFFWMFLSALLLLYRTLMVFSRMSKGAMMAIAFTVGYGAPLIIAVITVASTAGSQGYIQKDYNCWLNWSKTKALLAFVIPALTIVAINLLILIVVLCKMLRRGVNATTQQDEKHPLVVIARCVAILTPLFGLTWGFGIGTMVSPNFGIHVVFAFLNSLQGFFILMFGTLLDSKVREALARTFSLSNFSSIRTRSTSAGPSSSSGFPFFQRLRQRNVYNVSRPEMSSSNSDTATESYAARPML